MTTVARQLTVAFACLQMAGCGGGKTTPETRQAQTDSTRAAVDADTPVSIRFAIELSGATDGPIYVSLNGADNQLGWVTVFRDGERVYFGERCEIEDCGMPPAVCGAALPIPSIPRVNARDVNQPLPVTMWPVFAILGRPQCKAVTRREPHREACATRHAWIERSRSANTRLCSE